MFYLFVYQILAKILDPKCAAGYVEIATNQCLFLNDCINYVNILAPKIFNIEALPLIANYESKINSNCDSIKDFFSYAWDKSFEYFKNADFSNDGKIITINTDFLLPGEIIFKLTIYYKDMFVITTQQTTLLILNKVILFFF